MNSQGRKSGLSQSSWLQSFMNGWIFSSIFHISPFGPLPYEGGSMIIASYLLPRRISLSTNFTQSSTIHLIGASARPDDAAFSFAQVTIPLEASTCVTVAPAFAAAHVAPPVYAKRLRTFISFFGEFFISSLNQSQFAACSGKRPVCLKLNGFRLNVSSL